LKILFAQKNKLETPHGMSPHKSIF